MAAYRLPALSNVRPRGPFNPDAKTVTLPFGANWYIYAQVSDTNMSPGLAWMRVGSSVAIAPSKKAALSIIVFMCVFSLLFFSEICPPKLPKTLRQMGARIGGFLGV